MSFSPINMQRIFSSFLIFSSREFPFFLSLSPSSFLVLILLSIVFLIFQYKNLPTPSLYSVFLSGRSFYYKKFITWKSLRIITASITFTLSFTFFHYYFLLPHNNRYLQKYWSGSTGCGPVVRLILVTKVTFMDFMAYTTTIRVNHYVGTILVQGQGLLLAPVDCFLSNRDLTIDKRIRGVLHRASLL